MQELLYSAPIGSIKLIPTSRWNYTSHTEIPSVPFVTGKLVIENMDLSEKLVSLRVVEKV